MGDRGQVRIVKGKSVPDEYDHDIFLYTHWGSHKLDSDVRIALLRAKKDGRLDDAEYLSRIVFCQMVGQDTEGTTGYGISCSEHGDINLLITIDLDQNKVTEFRQYGDDGADEREYTKEYEWQSIEFFIEGEVSVG